MKEPKTRLEWRKAADAAVFSLGLEAAYLYGLIEPDPKVDSARCRAIIAGATERGVPIRSLHEILAVRP